VRVGRAALQVTTHQRVKIVARWVVRNTVLYLLTGTWLVARRLWEARTNARYERLMRAAEAAGDHDRLTDWEARAEQARERRHRRRMDWLEAPVAVVRAVIVTIMTGAGLLLGLGAVLAIGYQDFSWLLAPLRTATDLIAWLVWLLGVLWLPVALALPWAVVAGLWQVGGRSGAVPTWAAPGGSRDHATVIVTPGGIATALAHLGIPALNRAVKEGWQVEFSTPPVRVNRRGYQATFSLPMGVTPEMIADRRDVFARNLVRAPLEVWPTAAEQAGYVDLWVADQGGHREAGPALPAAARGHR
jgi:S-DNA-T family DNA segregation ATPase FtsK/SpoIIIE